MSFFLQFMSYATGLILVLAVVATGTWGVNSIVRFFIDLRTNGSALKAWTVGTCFTVAVLSALFTFVDYWVQK
jgi:hypothetical protein